MARAKQDLLGDDATSRCCRCCCTATRRSPGQGVVAETLQHVAAPRLPDRRNGARRRQQPHRLHDRADATAARRTYATDIAKMIQAPIFHVNGDDPEACVRVARLAFEYRRRSSRTS